MCCVTLLNAITFYRHSRFFLQRQGSVLQQASVPLRIVLHSCRNCKTHFPMRKAVRPAPHLHPLQGLFRWDKQHFFQANFAMCVYSILRFQQGTNIFRELLYKGAPRMHL
jgi:hypothetical protein